MKSQKRSKHRQTYPKRTWIIAMISVVLLIILTTGVNILPGNKPLLSAFDGERAYQDIVYQMNLGPRIPGSPAHGQTVLWLIDELGKAGWTPRIQEGVYLGKQVRNVIGQRGEGQPWIILGAHYDTRLNANKDPDPLNRAQPVPGANDGASGVAVLLELARVLPADMQKQIWIVFFDAEDNGGIGDWEWILGSSYFVSELIGQPNAAVVVDMVGDENLDIKIEKNSTRSLVQEIWSVADKLGYGEQFIPVEKYRILDDHKPFLDAGIPAVDIIDFNYPYWHTSQDTIDKVSASSLKTVGDTLFAWLLEK